MKRTAFLVLLIVLISGCAFIDRMNEDAKLSDATALSEGEKSPQQKAEDYSRPLQGLPYGAGVAAYPLSVLALGWFLKSLRGRRIRIQSAGTSDKPISGYLGKTTGIEAAIQFVADVTAAVFEVGKDGSGFKRGWKVFLSAIIGSAAFAPMVYPQIIDVIHGFLQAPPSWINGVALTAASALGTAVVAFLEKQIAKVKPLSENPA